MSAARDYRLEDWLPDAHSEEAAEPRQRRRWSVAEFHRLFEAEILPSEARVELVRGEIFEMSPMKPRHATGMRKIARALQRVFGEGFVVSAQLPLELDAETELHPDFSICAGELDDYADHHPTSALLVIEVSDSTLRFDRTQKAALYAAAGIPEYWIVDLKHRRVEVRREPIASEAAGGAHDYRVTTIHLSGQSLTPLSNPEFTIAVDALLPRAKEPNL